MTSLRHARTAVFLLVTAVFLSGTIPAGAGGTEPGTDCFRPVARTAGPVGTGPCTGIRPGAYVIIPSQNAGCTLGFVYADPKTSRWYITTAGHCVVPEGQQRSWPEGKGPIATDGNGRPFGRFVFGAQKGELDISLILVSRGITPKAAMCHFGGPTGLDVSRRGSPVILEHYGNSPFATAQLPARSGITNGMPDPWYVGALMPSFKGDSGGPVVDGDSGKAIGYVTALGIGIAFNGNNTPSGGPILITRLGPQMAYAMKVIKKTLVLKTAPHSPTQL